MSWQRVFLNQVADQHRRRCQRCFGFRILPFDAKTGIPLRGYVYSDDCLAFLQDSMDEKGLLEKQESWWQGLPAGEEWKKDIHLRAERFKKEFKRLMDKDGRIDPGKGPYVVKCPKCNGTSFIETEKSKLLRGLAKKFKESSP